MIEVIPAEMRARGTLSGWRDPIIFETPDTSDTGCALPWQAQSCHACAGPQLWLYKLDLLCSELFPAHLAVKWGFVLCWSKLVRTKACDKPGV